jgi:hypothetical protein
MKLFDRFRRPLWQHPDTLRRAEAVRSESAPELLRQLPQIAASDSAAEVRRAAITAAAAKPFSAAYAPACSTPACLLPSVSGSPATRLCRPNWPRPWPNLRPSRNCAKPQCCASTSRACCSGAA